MMEVSRDMDELKIAEGDVWAVSAEGRLRIEEMLEGREKCLAAIVLK